jgi:hypothetical protein
MFQKTRLEKTFLQAFNMLIDLGNKSNQLLLNNGDLVEVGRVDGDVGSHNDACGAYAGLNGGILSSRFGTTGTADAFKIYKSQKVLP